MICAGSFVVHDTQGPEAKHKTCMRLPSLRVRHVRPNETQDNMRQYLQFNTLFTILSTMIREPPDPPRRVFPGVRVPLHRTSRWGLETITMGDDVSLPTLQKQFLHREVRVARVELLRLLCKKLQLRPSVTSFRKLNCLQWTFGHKLVVSGPDDNSSSTYWATDTRYSQGPRRDNFLLGGTVQFRGSTQALCLQATCFVTIHNLGALNHELPDSVMQDVVDDSVTYVLGRWFTPHQTAVGRDEHFLPRCPGPLGINHALWTFAKTDTPRLAMVCANGTTPTAAFDNARYLFGRTREEQQRNLHLEKYAYYDLVSTSSIQQTVTMTPEYEGASMTKTQNWLQSITLV